jgi:1-acyl-sn-glycerol-3-phosphate acyltransferase
LRVWRALRLLLHLAQGVLTAAVLFPLLSPVAREAVTRRWSRRLVGILQVRLQVSGRPPEIGTPAVIVSNHVSWVDIWLIDSQRACRFVAKSEVRDWPILGWLAQRAGTLFIQRARRHHTAALNTQITRALSEGACVAMFPEGTTTDGRQLRRFFSSLLQPAADAGARLIPVALRYVQPNGELDLTPAYCDDITLLQSLTRILAARELFAELSFLPSIDTGGKSRRVIAHAAQEAIAGALNLPFPGRTPETEPDPPTA